MLSIIAADSIQLEPNQEPFRLTLSYNGEPHDYWLLRGELPGVFGALQDHEFIALRGRYDDGQLPLSWEEIAAEITAAREAVEYEQ